MSVQSKESRQALADRFRDLLHIHAWLVRQEMWGTASRVEDAVCKFGEETMCELYTDRENRGGADG